MMASTSRQDEVFGLPFLFTGGLPNALEKFSEGNLRCFLTYLIDVVGKANRQNVWQKPPWWKSALIPYSPITIDTSNVQANQVLSELRGLVESCYKYYRAEKILEVSKQLADIPRILLGIKDNKDNTLTVYDKLSKAVYVTVRPENLRYDLKSLDKVSKDWRSSYDKEDVTFTEIKKTSKTDKICCVIELSDSDDEKVFVKRESPRKKQKSLSPSSSENKYSITPLNRHCKQKEPPPWHMNSSNIKNNSLSKHKSRGLGIAIKSGNDIIIALSDSDDDSPDKKNSFQSSSNNSKILCNVNIRKTSDPPQDDDSDDIQFIGEIFSSSRPCPKRFKKSHQPVAISQNVIILSDSEDENEDSLFISSYTSLAENFPSNKKFYPETPNKNVQKSILGPLLCSPKKDLPQTQKVAQPSVMASTWCNTTKPVAEIPVRNKSSFIYNKSSRRRSCAPNLNRYHLREMKDSSSSSEENIFKPTQEELHLMKKKVRLYLPALKEEEKHDFTVKSQTEFMNLLGMTKKDVVITPEKKVTNPSHHPDFVSLIHSMKASYTRMPLEWLQALIGNNNSFIVSKKGSRYRQNTIQVNYEPYCSTNKALVEYSIKTNSKIGKDRRADRQSCRRGSKVVIRFFLKKLRRQVVMNMKIRRVTRSMGKKEVTIEKWFLQNEETSHRNKRASLRMLRSLCTGDQSISPLETLSSGTLAPTLESLPSNLFERCLQMTVSIYDTF